MKITSLTLDGSRLWPALAWDAGEQGLHVVFGPAGSGKTTIAELITHVLYGRSLRPAEDAARRDDRPEGELIVETGGRRYRLRRSRCQSAVDRLTLAALDGSAVDRHTIRELVGGLSPALLGPVFAPTFHEPYRLDALLSLDFVHEFHTALGIGTDEGSTVDQGDLIAHRDRLARELETLLAERRRQSRELDTRWHELDRLVDQAKHECQSCRDRLRAAETDLAETEAWLRGHQTVRREIPPPDSETEQAAADLDRQIAQWRQTLAELERRSNELHTRLAQIQPSQPCQRVALARQQARLAATRRLATDVDGEVSRLARAADAGQCLCDDAHPRLRPLVTMLFAQLDALETMIDDQRQAADARELAEEASHLLRTQHELRNQLDHLLDRRHALDRVRRANDAHLSHLPESAGDALAPLEELSIRRIELWRERNRLREELAQIERRLRELRDERQEVERRRTEVLATHRLRALQQELAEVQDELEQYKNCKTSHDERPRHEQLVRHASSFLAQLTDGKLIELRLADERSLAVVVDRNGNRHFVDRLTPTERDQVHWSLCLGWVVTCAERGVRLPLVLDEPPERLSGRDLTAWCAVVAELAERGQQVLVFTRRQELAERFASVGAAVHPMHRLYWDAPGREIGNGYLSPERPEGQPAQRAPVAESAA